MAIKHRKWLEMLEQMKFQENVKVVAEDDKPIKNSSGKVVTPMDHKNALEQSSKKTTTKTSSKKTSTKTTATNKDEDKKWYQKIFTSGEFDDGYQIGDISKTILGTGVDITQDVSKSLLAPIESVVDIGTNLVATGANALGFEDTAKSIRDFADKNISENISNMTSNTNPLGMLYNVVNGTPENIINPMGIDYDTNKSFVENYTGGLKKAYLDGVDTNNYEQSSFFGEYADKTVELVGYVVALAMGGKALTSATGTAKVGLATKTGKTAIGATASGGNIGVTLAGKTLNLPTLAIAGGMSKGLQEANSKENVSESERWAKGISDGLIEGVAEGMFGMFGIGGVTNEAGEEIFEFIGKKASKAFSSRAGKVLMNAGIKSTAETTEEFVAYSLGYLADNKMIDKMGEADFSKEWDWGELGETLALSFVSSFITQGGGDVIQTNIAISEAENQLGRKLTSEEKALVTQATIEGTLEEKVRYLEEGRDYDTGLTSNEQKVVDVELENRINKLQEKLGRELTNKEIAKITEEVQNEFKKGYISTDTIENTLLAEDDAEITALQERLAQETDPKSKADIQSLIHMNELNRQTNLDNLLKNNQYFQESYNEKTRKTQDFTYEASEKLSEQRKTIYESAKELGLNNTNRTHETIDFYAKIAEDRKTNYKLVNNAKLEELGYSVEGATIDGLVTGKNGEVLINIESPKALNKVVGHETTHLLEGTEEYKHLQDFAIEYAKTKGDYQARVDTLNEVYKGINADLKKELTSDIVGEYLFTDEQFINDLSVQKPNVFQKVYNYIKHLYKMATAGSTEARQLEQLKYKFEKAYNKNVSNNNNSDTRYSFAGINAKNADLKALEVAKEMESKDVDAETIRKETGWFRGNEGKWRFEIGNEKAVLSEKVQGNSWESYDANRKKGELEKKIEYHEKRFQKNMLKDANVLEREQDFIDKYRTEIAELNEIIEKSKVNLNFATLYNYSNNFKRSYKLNEILQNDELFEAYPDLKDVNIVMPINKDTNDTTLAYVKGEDTNNIYLTASGLKNINNLKSTLLHEIQHLIQQKEGFSSGADLVSWYQHKRDEVNKKLGKLYNEIEHKLGEKYWDTYTKLNELENLVLTIEKNKDEISKYDTAIEKGDGWGYRYLAMKETAQIETEKAQTEAKMLEEELKKTIGEDKLNEYKGYLEELKEFSNGRGAEAYRLYKNTAGEIEAREVENRIDYTEKQRKEIAPFIKDENTVYADFETNSEARYSDVDNTNPTSNPDIRYSLSKDGSMIDEKGNKVTLEATDTGRTLMAIHNLNEDKLKGILELGGFPFPSIAITNPSKINHSHFGSISVLFDKNTIDPQLNSKNKVYSRDGYTPRFPRVEYDTNSNVLKNLRDRVRNLGDYSTNRYVSEANSFLDNIEDFLNNRNGFEGLIDTAKKNEALKYLYIKENNIPFKEQYKEEAHSRNLSNELLQKFLDNYKGDKNTLNELSSDEIYNNLKSDIEQLWIEDNFRTEEEKGFLEKHPDFTPNLNYGALYDIVMGAYKLNKYGTRQVLDTAKTNELINSTVKQEEFEAWLRNEFKDIISKKGLRNNKDYYTPSGNPRSFDQLHDEYTLDNVVKIMTSLNDTGAESNFITGTNEIAGNASIRFDSIAEIKAREDLIQRLSDEKYSELLRELGDRLTEVEDGIVERGHKNSSNPFMAMDNLSKAIAEMARRFGQNKRVTPSAIVKELNEWGYYPTQEEAQTILDMFSEMRELPTEYFEAKPQRAVRFDEVQAIVVPNDIDTELKQQLHDNGLNVIEYDPNIEGDRQAKINELDDLKFSLSPKNQDIAPTGSYEVYGRDLLKQQVEEAIAPLQEQIRDLTNQLARDTLSYTKPAETPNVEEIAPVTEPVSTMQDEIDNLIKIRDTQSGSEYASAFYALEKKYGKAELYKALNRHYKGLPVEEEAPLNVMEKEPNIDSIAQNEIAPIAEDTTPDTMPDTTTVESPFDTRDIKEVGKRNVKAYQYENPEVRPFFQQEAQSMLGDLANSIKGHREYSDALYYQTNGEEGWYGVDRQTTDDISYLLDNFNYTYAEIEKGLKAIIEDNGAENIAVAKRIEFMLDERLRKGYTNIDGVQIPANQDYINLLNEKQATEHNTEISSTLSDKDIPYVEAEPAPITPKIQKGNTITNYAKTPVNPNMKAEKNKGFKIKSDNEIVANVLADEQKTVKDKNKRTPAIILANIVDKGLVFENLALRTKNRDLQGKWDYTLTSGARGQYIIGKGHFDKGTHISKSLNEIIEEVGNTGYSNAFSSYMYHLLNIDRMTLKERHGIDNKPVFGESVTAEQSREIVKAYEDKFPKFKEFAQDVYEYVNADRDLLVKDGVISEQTAELWSKMYPHYVPIRRVGHEGNAINVPLDTKRTGINAPIQKATGGNSDILPMFDTIALRTLQIQRATAKNNFGLELERMLNTSITSKNDTHQITMDEILDSIDNQDKLLQKGDDGNLPTFTVFKNGKKVTFEITEDMYDALSPLSDSSLLSKTNKILNTANNIRRGLLTEYNPVFWITNMFKDVQDVLLNSQHATKTYAKLPEAYIQLVKKGYWYKEYVANGGEQNSYFDSQDINFTKESLAHRIYPLRKISELNNFIEMAPRLAEYIASREAGRSIETSMLDASRVTTNFKAGGDLTKFLNRNGFTFLNASVQGAMQQVRNVREANANGLRGWANLATKYALAGIPALILNGLLWGDDDEYEELSDYVKQSYYIVGKNEDGTFIRIPKGRAVAVIQEAFNQIGNLITGNDEADLKSFLDLVVNNLAPNNPLENNLIAPVIQAVNNKTWYGGDLVPTRLQDLPEAEQFDESTDSFSKWLGEMINVSPVKINYLIDQYSGGVGDVILPMLTPEAENGSDSLLGDVLAPFNDKFTTNSTLNNQNVSDFYDLSDELTTEAKKSKATDEDIVKNKYINSVKSEMNELYKQKREVQNSDLSDSEKYDKVLGIQSQINSLAKEALSGYENVSVEENYSKVEDREYRINNNGEWTKITEDQLEKQNKVTNALGITPNEYWSDRKEEYDFAYEKPAKYALATTIADYNTYKGYTGDLYDLKADKDSSGKSISGSRKEKVIEYVNDLDIDYGQRLLLFKSEYKADDTYNYDIIDYLNEREDIDFDEMKAILEELDFTVTDDGDIYWD